MFEGMYIGAYWRKRKLSLSEYSQLVLGIIKRLGSLSPKFGNPNIDDGASLNEITLADFVSTVMKSQSNDIAYINSTHNNVKLNENSYSPVGFVSCIEYIGFACLTISAGSFEEFSPVNSVVLTFENSTELELHFIKEVLTEVIDYFQPENAVVTSHDLAAKIDPEFEDDVPLGLITYFYNAINIADLPVEICNIGKNGMALIVADESYPRMVDTLLSLRQELKLDGRLLFS